MTLQSQKSTIVPLFVDSLSTVQTKKDMGIIIMPLCNSRIWL